MMGAAVTGLATDAVFVVDANTRRLLQANRAFSRVFGYASEEVSSLSLFDIAASEKADMQAKLATLEREGEIDLGVRPFRRKDGATMEMEVKAGQMVFDSHRLFCVIARDLSERRRTERALLESEERFRKLAEAAFEGIAITEGGLFRDASPRMAELLGAPLDELLGRPVSDFVAAESMDKVALHMRSGSEQPYEHLARRADGTAFPVEVQAKAITFGGRSMRVTAIRDISGRKKLEKQLRLAQRMESVGRLAGGVAHDFNNLLTVILSATETVKASPRLNDTDREDVVQIEGAAQRAAELTRQLLAFARQQIVEPRSVDLNVLTANVGKILRRLVGEDVELVTLAGDGLGAIRADPAQVEQVLMNLAVNARDAMPSGGRLSVETANVTVDEARAINHPEVKAGQYVMVRFIDTGVGMDGATLAHIFEPFFTTKPAGKGTGLGLATCYGIVRQAGGFISVSSEPDKGTTFEVYFPREQAGPTTYS
jgi:two-component system cell cycle sensor histidine kinase/response regulator CckA